MKIELPYPKYHPQCDFEYYTEQQMIDAINDALEAAAKVCDSASFHSDISSRGFVRDVYVEVGKAIREMKQ